MGTVVVNDYTGENLIAAEDSSFANDLVVEVNVATLGDNSTGADIRGDINPLEQVDYVIFDNNSSLKLNEAQALNLATRLELSSDMAAIAPNGSNEPILHVFDY